MAKEQVGVRLGKLARELNVSVSRLVEFLRAQGKDIEKMPDAKYPNLKVDTDCCELARQEFAASAEKQRMQVNKQREREAEKAAAQAKAREAKAAKAEAQRALAMAKAAEKEAQEAEAAPSEPEKPVEKAEPRAAGIQVQRTIDLDAIQSSSRGSRGRGGKGKKAEASAKSKATAASAKPKETPPPAKVEKPTPPAKTPAQDPPETSQQPMPTPPEPERPSTPAPQVEVPKEKVEKPAPGIKVLGQIDLDDPTGEKKAAREAKAAKEALEAENAAQAQAAAEAAAKEEAQAEDAEPEVFRPSVEKLEGPKVLGKLDAAALNRGARRKPEASATPGGGVSKRRRRRISVDGDSRSKQKGKKPQTRQEISMADVEEKLRETQSRIASKRGGKTDTRKYRAEKKSILEARRKDAELATEQERSVLRISEFVSVNELSVMMDVPVTSVIETCMNMGLMVSINYRLDAESLALVADEFGFKVEFIDVNDHKEEEEEEDPALLEPRPPVFVVMGHVDHGKTTLMDAIRSSNTVASEAGGITQHISAYSFSLKSGEHKGRKLTLIDTPGHESFTAMRARGAKLTDVAIIVVAADDGVMPQTIEAINHASVMGANIVFAITKIDSPKADPERVKTQLADHNYLVEEWGGKYQSQDISALKNQNVDLLLEKVLLEADMLELKANPHKRANATVLESMVDKGLGHCVRVLVHAGTLRKGDSIVSAGFFGRVKTLFDDRRKKVKEAGPSMPVTVVGLNGAPQAGDPLVAVESDKEARSLAQQQGRIRREMEMRSRKHITLDEIGRRIAIGNFQELNVIVKGDVIGSVEALSDALLELSTDEIRVKVIHSGVGQITETDVTLAASAEAIIVGFQVRPSHEARRKAENEQIDIRLYSIIYDAIEEIKSAMEGMLMPEVREDVLGTAEVMEVYKISKVGTVAGCVVREGKILRGSKVHIIRDGVVVYTSELISLKRFKDEAKEVNVGMDCGMAVKGYNDIKVGDFIESFKETEVHRTLE